MFQQIKVKNYFFHLKYWNLNLILVKKQKGDIEPWMLTLILVPELPFLPRWISLYIWFIYAHIVISSPPNSFKRDSGLASEQGHQDPSLGRENHEEEAGGGGGADSEVVVASYCLATHGGA